MARIDKEDARLGRRRPEVIASLRAAVSADLDAARLLRLRRDQWVLRQSIYRDYQRAVGSQLLGLVKVRPQLEALGQHLDEDRREHEPRSERHEHPQRLPAHVRVRRDPEPARHVRGGRQEAKKEDGGRAHAFRGPPSYHTTPRSMNLRGAFFLDSTGVYDFCLHVRSEPIARTCSMYRTWREKNVNFALDSPQVSQ